MPFLSTHPAPVSLVDSDYAAVRAFIVLLLLQGSVVSTASDIRTRVQVIKRCHRVSNFPAHSVCRSNITSSVRSAYTLETYFHRSSALRMHAPRGNQHSANMC